MGWTPQGGSGGSDKPIVIYYDPTVKDDAVKTNGNRIRAMSDEELAKTLCAMTDEGCPPWHDADISLCHNHGVCHDGECWLKWLKQEVTN